MALILGIDTSCDDTGVGIVDDDRVLANVVASQTALHQRYGGVMPEHASREHLAVIDEVVTTALTQAQVGLDDLEAVAATNGPGLVGALLVGLCYAKALAWARELPFFAIHHLEGHVASSTLAGGAQPPFLCLIASGGHTVLFDVPSWGDYRLLGRSRDDAAGEAFDKVARLLELGYPGGPALSALAESGDDRAIALPLPMKTQTGFDFSFSGLKTAVAVKLEKEPDIDRADMAASFERTVVESLVSVTVRAAKRFDRRRLVVAGGVAANRRLRRRFQELELDVNLPPVDLTTDNGAMIALAAATRLVTGLSPAGTDWSTDAQPYLPLGTETLRRASS